MPKPNEERSHREFECGAAGWQPFVHRIRIRRGDFDRAAITHAARIPAWALEAIEAWWHHAGLDWYQINLDRGVGTPFVHMKVDLRSPLTPRHSLDCEVAVTRLGHRSVTHAVRGSQNGVLCFEGEFVEVFVDAKTLKPRTLPADILASMRTHTLEK
jgi:acyl-CoA thioesterase FadM